MKTLIRASFAFIFAASFAASSNAVVLTFDNNILPSYMSTGGNMLWNGTGGGHYYDENYNGSSSFFFSTDTTVNSFDLNGLPWQGYSLSTGLTDYLVQAFDAGNNLIWSDNIDLSAYGVGTWGSWLTVNVDTANVRELRFGPAGPSGWPSIDNMVLNESVPEPLPMALLALGLIGLFARRRRT